MAKKRKKRTNNKPEKITVESSGPFPLTHAALDGMGNLAGEIATKPEPTQVRITHRRKRLKNMFLADAVRDQNDQDFLNKEISKREYKGKLKTITTIKHCDPIDGEWVTEFIIDLKE